MPLAPGTRFGPYEVKALAGAGGMGEVYRAQDTRLDRLVAIKIIPSETTRSATARQRFEREARVVGSLNHPNICTLYDVGEQNGAAFLVTEYVEGETLEARLARGPLAWPDALRCATEILLALECAHGHGVVHRDLKPSNIMLTKNDAKLLDFGLARLKDLVGAQGEGSILFTRTTGLTTEGTLVGTLQYMSPEQLEGKEADARSDLFSFGAVLYEAITGRKAFTGGSPASLIASILNTDPAPASTLMPDHLPRPALDRIMRKSLAKAPEARWQTARDLRDELLWVADSAMPAPVSQSRTPIWTWASVAVLTAIVAALAFAYARKHDTQPETVRFSVAPPKAAGFTSTPAVSPDGTRLAFAAMSQGHSLIWIRPLNSTAAYPVNGTEDGYNPFWSPDSRHLGFFANRKMKKVEVNSPGEVGGVQTIADSNFSRGGTWNRDGVILFAPTPLSPIFRVSDSGGEPVPVTRLAAREGAVSHRWPFFLPDGRHFLYYFRSADAGQRGIYMGSIDAQPEAQPKERLIATGSNAMYAPGLNGGPGHLVFEREGVLLAQAFDAASLTVKGEPFAIAQPVSSSSPDIAAGFTASAKVLVYGAGLTAASELAIFDRASNRMRSFSERAVYVNPRVSPDGTRLVVSMIGTKRPVFDLWLIELGSGLASRFTDALAGPSSAVWSRDGQFIVYDEYFEHEIRRKKASGGGEAERIYKGALSLTPTDWTPDGRYLVCQTDTVGAGSDIYLIPMSDGAASAPVPFLTSKFNEWGGQVSPDGRWMAYTSSESGEGEVYVTSFPDKNTRVRISADGGQQPRWGGDGAELYYIASGGRLLAVPLKRSGTFDVSRPVVLTTFPTFPSSLQAYKYDVTANGTRFIIVSQYGANSTEPLTVVVNWLGHQ